MLLFNRVVACKGENMGKDLNGVYIGKGYRQRKDGRYEARATINGEKICIYDMDLEKLKVSFQKKRQLLLQNQNIVIVTLNDWSSSWFRECKAPQLKSDIVRKNYKTKMRNTYCSILGDRILNEITQKDIQCATNELTERGYVKRTVSEALSLLRECLEIALLNDLIKHNPCVGIKIKNDNLHAEHRLLTIQEQQKFLSYVKGSYYYEVYKFLLVTGVRIGELSALQWKDIDFDKKCIYIRYSLTTAYFDGIKYQKLTSPKSYNSYRTIPFFDETEEILKIWQAKQNNCKSKIKERWRLSSELGDLVFTTTMGSPITRYVLAGHMNKIVAEINRDECYQAILEHRNAVIFESVSPHAFRHTFATRCFEKKMKPRVIQKLMGHANYDTTLSYTHLYDEYVKDEVEKIGKFI